MTQAHQNCKPIFNLQYELEVVECVCGYHMGIDATYLEQKGAVKATCPACQKELIVPGFE
jgi:hypothetical protein